MKYRMYVRAGCAACLCLCASFPVCADNEVPCLVVSGEAPGERRIDLARLNRITFGPESMTVTSSSDEGSAPQELLYSLYHHIEFKNAIPDIETGMALNEDESENILRYLSDSRSLLLRSVSNSPFTVGIFDIEGKLILTADMISGDPLSLESLPPGIYVAIATDKRINLNIKFRHS